MPAGSNGPSDNRHCATHVQVVHPDDVARFAGLGVVVNGQPLWACLDAQMAELTLPVLGPERSSWQYPFASLVRAGARLCFGSGWSVSTPDVMAQVQVAVNRTPPPSGASVESRDVPGVAAGGRKQRLAHPASLVMQVKRILSGEPTGEIEPKEIGGMRDLLRDLAADVAMFSVTRIEMGFARPAADRAAMMDEDGDLVGEDPSRKSEKTFATSDHDETGAFLAKL